MSTIGFALGHRLATAQPAPTRSWIRQALLACGAISSLLYPTPGLGIVERVMIYSPLLWVAALSVALLRRPAERPEGQVQ